MKSMMRNQKYHLISDITIINLNYTIQLTSYPYPHNKGKGGESNDGVFEFITKIHANLCLYIFSQALVR